VFCQGWVQLENVGDLRVGGVGFAAVVSEIGIGGSGLGSWSGSAVYGSGYRVLGVV